MPSAHVTSISAVREFRAALVEFADEASAALGEMTAQIHRALDWIEHEQPPYWQQQIRLAFDEVAEARLRLDTCLMRTVGGQRPGCIEEKQDLARARKRLEYCQSMVPKAKAWVTKFHRETDEYRGRMGSLTRIVEIELPRMIAMIENTAVALERYAEVLAVPEPRAASPPPDES